MIDFRYHLVSLVAVFMALAVGIVLGAGPLGQEISSTLEAQVKDLREERNGLRAQLDQAEGREQLKNQAFQIATPALVDGQLTGRRVALVTMPGADRNIVGQLQDHLVSAGAEVALVVRLEDEWADPDAQATRHEAASELSGLVDDPEPREGAEPTLETVLAATLAGADESVGSGVWLQSLDRLEELNFLSTNWSDNQGTTPEAPDSLLVLTGDLDVQQVEEEESGDPRLQQSLDLIAALGEVGTPTLVAGYGTESFADPVQAAESPIVRGVRAESAIAETVASVDNVEGPAGQLAAVLGLRWMIDGEPGHWGVGTDALATVPTVPEPLEPTATEGPMLPFDPTLAPPIGEDSGAEGDDAGPDGSQQSGDPEPGSEGQAPDAGTGPTPGNAGPTPGDVGSPTTGPPAP